MALPRNRLLARLFAAEPQLIRLVAGAGYGKSSLARLFARRYERHAICDCLGVSDGTEFANRALSALAAELPSGSDAITQLRLRLHATDADAAAWSRALLDVWKAHNEQALFIVEHAEAIAENGTLLALFGDLLAARPAERVVLVSSRVPLPIRFSNYVAPHHMLTLTRSELRFEDAEARDIFAGSDVSPELVERIVRLADGWPSVLLLIARLAQYDSSIDRLLERLGDLPSEDLYECLGREVLSAFTPEMMSAMLATASIPNASLEDIFAATGVRNATLIVDRLLHLPGFISSETGAYQVHPLLQGALRSQSGTDQANYLLRAAARYEGEGDYLRAAELYATSGDECAAAAALDRLPAETLQRPTPRLVDVLTKIEMAIICTQPNLWVAMLPERRSRVDTATLHDEALGLLQSMSPDAPRALERRLRVRLAILAQELERLAEARAVMESSTVTHAANDAPEERRLALMTLALIAAKQGRFAESDRLVDEAESVLGARHLRFDRERAQIAAERSRLLGDWHGALKMSEEALYAAQRTGDTARIIEAARDVARAAWYCDDDARVLSANELLEDCGDVEARAFVRYVKAMLTQSPVDAPPLALHAARLHAALVTTDQRLAEKLFDEAIEGVDAFENAFPRIVMRVCAALLLPSQRRRLLEARVIAQSIESPPLEASLELIIDSTEPLDHGIFKYLAARVSRSPLRTRRDVLTIQLVGGQVRRGHEPLHVSDRGFELLVALALHAPGTPKEELASCIWPGLDAEAAFNALKMCVSRTRAQLGDKEAIANTKHGYALSQRVTVDLHEYEQLLRIARSSETVGEALRRQLEEAIRSFEAGGRTYAADWAWFVPHDARLDEVYHELNLVLAEPAITR